MGDQRGLKRARVLAAEPNEIGDAIGLGLSFKRSELVDLSCVRRHQKLSASLVRNARLPAERVQHRFAIDAEPRFDEPRRIIDAGVDDFAIARTDAVANPARFFDDNDFPAGPSEPPRDRETDHACADDQTLDRFHPSTLLQVEHSPPLIPQPFCTALAKDSGEGNCDRSYDCPAGFKIRSRGASRNLSSARHASD